MFVLTFIARSARADLTDLENRLEQLAPTVAFTRTYPDELQGAFDQAEDALAAALLGARFGGFWVGLGAGELVRPRFAAALGAISTPECSGAALSLSRSAVEQAQTGAPPRGICVHAAGQGVRADQVTGLLRLLYRVASARTEAEWRVLDLLVPGVRGQQKAVAQALGITSQAVSKTLVRSYWHEELASRALVAELLEGLEGQER
ncbi:MAG: recombinase RecJ [Rothia sp. (in: high G+C Gram-positive bacteria)]|uniref:recombinase RecJ n=1 Tax=Rothia sp. (in: high G+C Gram-positive bacteria) TaxID=1885016 RepID=UPI0026F5C9E7|nr:recombinase RecJ [Rothia sp. (in: high G+C Gram-positive bacteria)]